MSSLTELKGSDSPSFFLLSAFLLNFFLCQDRLSGDVPPHMKTTRIRCNVGKTKVVSTISAVMKNNDWEIRMPE